MKGNQMIDAGRFRQLFLDDFVVGESQGVTRTLHQPKDAKPVLLPDTSRGERETTGRNPPQWNPGKGVWEWWYWTGFDVPPMGEKGTTNQRISTYAISPDGVHWEKPNLGLYEFRGSCDNHIAWSPEEDRQSHVLRDENDKDPSRRYKGFFGANGRQPAFSANGFDWQILDVPRIPSQDTSNLFWDPYNEQWAATIKHRTEWGRSVWLITSKDFGHWTDAELILTSDETDSVNKDRRIQKVIDDPAFLSPPLVDDVTRTAEIYWLQVLPYEGLYIGFPMVFNPAGAIPPPHGNFTGLNQTELAVSRDLYHWERVAERALFLEVLPWDGVNFGTAQRGLSGHPVVREDEIWVYHNGNRFRGAEYLYDFLPREQVHVVGSLHLGKLRRDGFVSLGAGETPGTVITKPFSGDGASLHVNVDAAGGELGAEILDAETRKPIDGMAGTVRGDHLDAAVVSGLQRNTPLRVKFTVHDSELFAFWIE